jgi:hypothetical protein
MLASQDVQHDHVKAQASLPTRPQSHTDVSEVHVTTANILIFSITYSLEHLMSVVISGILEYPPCTADAITNT